MIRRKRLITLLTITALLASSSDLSASKRGSCQCSYTGGYGYEASSRGVKMLPAIGFALFFIAGAVAVAAFKPNSSSHSHSTDDTN